jgi:hypothetical protein
VHGREFEKNIYTARKGGSFRKRFLPPSKEACRLVRLRVCLKTTSEFNGSIVQLFYR